VRLVFDVFERRRTVNGVFDYLVAPAVTLPRRPRSGPAKGEVEWTGRTATRSLMQGRGSWGRGSSTAFQMSG